MGPWAERIGTRPGRPDGGWPAPTARSRQTSTWAPSPSASRRSSTGSQAARRGGARGLAHLIGHDAIAVTNGVHTPTWIGRRRRLDPGAQRSARSWPTRCSRPEPVLETARRSTPTPSGGPREPQGDLRPLRPWSPPSPDGTPRRLPRRAARRRDDAADRPAHPRLRPPLRHLQAGHAHVLGLGPPPGPAQGPGEADPDRLRRQGPSGRPARAGVHPPDRGTVRSEEFKGHVFTCSRTTTPAWPDSWCRGSTCG
jgi:hypothetical protein